VSYYCRCCHSCCFSSACEGKGMRICLVYVCMSLRIPLHVSVLWSQQGGFLTHHNSNETL
jgi:hypothetical protein